MLRFDSSLGTAASLALHAVAGVLVVFGWPYLNPPAPEPIPAIPVELISEAELAEIVEVPEATKAEEPPKEPEPEPEPEPVEPEPEPVAPEPEPEPEPAKPDPLPEPEPEPTEPAPEPEPEPEPEPVRPEPAPEPEPEPEKDELDFAALEDGLVDLDPDQRDAPREVAEGQGAERDQERVGLGERLLVSEEAKVQACMASDRGWQQLTGVPNVEQLVVVVTFTLERNGTLASQPKVENAGQIARSGNQFWRVAQDRAVQAAISCAPYDYLAPERYDQWRRFEMTFRPPAS